MASNNPFKKNEKFYEQKVNEKFFGMKVANIIDDDHNI